MAITVINNPVHRRLLVEDPEASRIYYAAEKNTGIPIQPPTHAWMLFSYEGLKLMVLDSCSLIRWQETITGARGISSWWVNDAWERAREATADLSKIALGKTTPPESRITGHVASYLAMKDRVDRWGGFENEAKVLPNHFAQLSGPERRAVEARLRGEVVL